MSRIHFSIISFLLLAVVVQSQALAQSPAAAPETPAAATPADTAFAAISTELRNVYKSINNKGGIEDTDKPVINKLLERVNAFSQQFPNDNRGLAASLIINEWLGETAKVEALYRQLLAKAPENDQIALSFARRLRGENRYAEATDVLRAHTFKPENQVESAQLLSECLFDDNQFGDALAVLLAIPAELLADDAVLKTQIESDKVERQKYVEMWAAETALRDAEQAANDLPQVIIETSRGPILLELFENEAPNTVANFIKLAEQGYYNGTKFHRVIPNFMIQGGDPNSKADASAGAVPGMGGPGYTIPDEHFAANRRNHFAGSLSMANTGAPNSGGSQFFITHQPTPHLNGMHTVFGRVVDGMPTVRTIKQDDEIKKVVVLRKREHAYEPKTLSETPAAPAPISLGTPENPIEIKVPVQGGTVTATMPAAP